MSLTLIIILAIVIIVASFVGALGKAVGAGGNVKDLFPRKKNPSETGPSKEDLKTDEDKTS